LFSSQRRQSAHRPRTARRLGAAVLAGSLAVGLSGCALVQTSADKPLTGLEACALGKAWKLDMQDLTAKLTEELAGRGVTLTAATAEGDTTFEWDLESKVVVTSDYTITLTSAPAEGQVLTVTSRHTGTSTGIAYINSDVAIPRDWDGTGLDVTVTADNNGTAVDPLPYELPNLDIDDSVGIELTCDGGTMTTHQRGSDITLTWKS
jgi:hypothetical protein